MSGYWSLETPLGAGGLALMRLRGSGARESLAKLTPDEGPPPRGERLSLTTLSWQGAILDEVLIACVIDAGEEVFELGLHGGPAVVRAVAAALEELGVEEEVAGEGRSWGRSSLRWQASSRLMETWSAPASSLLIRALNGELEAVLQTLSEQVLKGTAEVRRRLCEAIADYSWTRSLLCPVAVALIGSPNAGKSTLFNALIGDQRALTSDRPGTTRDFLEEEVLIDGWPARLIDTAGLRESVDPIESAGMRLGSGSARRAALRVCVVDAAAPIWPEELEEPWLGALNKADLVEGDAEELPRGAPGGAARWSLVSGKERRGLEELASAIRGQIAPGAPRETRAAIFEEEQETALRQALEHFDAGRLQASSETIRRLFDSGSGSSASRDD